MRAVGEARRQTTTQETRAPDCSSGSVALLEAAVSHATAHVPVATPGQIAGDVRDALIGREFESAEDVAVLEGRVLRGLVTIEQLLAADAQARIEEVMDADPPVVSPDADQELVAWEMCHRGESSAAVVDGEGHFVGLVPPYRMVQVLLAEHDEDLARLGGYMKSTGRARRAAEEPIARRLWHRLPWLLIGLVGAMASAVIVGAFEAQLSKVVLLAFFLPGVVYMADAVGTQTEAVLIRGLSVGIAMRTVFRRELVSGALIGAIMGLAFLPFALIGWANADVAVAVALALFAACSIATVIAMALPLAFQRLGRDPAFGSGPLATVIQDLLSIVVYLAIAAPIAT
jgi:magnesium transporter